MLEVLDVDAALRVLADGDDLGDRLAPGQLVGVVLVGPDEDHRSLAALEPQHADELVDGPGRAGAAEDDDVVGAAVDGLWMMARACSRSSVVRRPVAEASVCVLAYIGSTCSRMKSSMKPSERPDAVASA